MQLCHDLNESKNKDENLDDIQRFVESERPKNTNKKNYNLNV